MNFTTFVSKAQVFFTKHLLVLLGGAIVLLATFQAGVVVGIHKASFGFRMGDNYYRAFGDDRGRIPFGEMFGSAHGAAGKVVSVALPTLIVDDHGIEKVVHIESDTSIRNAHAVGTSTDIHAGSYVIVLGEPHGTEVAARLIRIVPAPPTASSTPQ